MSWFDRFRRVAQDPQALPGQMTVDDFIFGDHGITTVQLHLPDVTEHTLLQIPAAYDAVNVLVTPVLTLPLVFFRREVDGDRVLKHRITDHPVKKLLAVPNDWQNRVNFLDSLLRDLVIHHNAYNEEVIRDGVIELIPHDPRTVGCKIQNGLVSYIVTEGGVQRTIPAERMWHMKVGPYTEKGLKGRGPLLTNQPALQAALAVLAYGARFFGNDTSPSGGYWGSPEGLSDQARKNLTESLRGKLGGPNQHRTIVAEEGLKFVTVNVPNDKAQFIETQRHGAVEMARIFGVPPHKIRSLQDATFSNIEQQALEFVIYSLAPWLSAIETSIKTDLIGLDNPVFAEFNVMGLLRGDVKARFDAYTKGRQWGWLSADDVRSLENMNPLPDGIGESYLIPLNMSDASEDDIDSSA